LSSLAEAWQKRPDTIGMDGLVLLARERSEGQCRAVKQSLLDAAQEQAILQRLGALVVPSAVLAELRLKKTKHLLIIPDGSLHYLPFAMLRIAAEDGSATRYLLEEFSVSYTPAMTTLETIRKQRIAREQSRKVARHPLLAFANPAYGAEGVVSVPAKASGDAMITRLRSVRGDYYSGSGLRLTSLPETEQEAMRVASLFGPPTCVRAEAAAEADATALVLASRAASEDQVKRLLGPRTNRARPGWQYVLFSTHGLADPQNGMLSCIALSAPSGESAEDGFLQAQEVLDLELDADLVMLSACQTGLGRMRGGEGLVGLCGTFFVAGAESVCASLWSVPSDPTGQLVTEFFKGLKSGTMNRAEALRQAQLTVLRSGQTAQGKPADYSSPFCWAAFVLAGEYRMEEKE
jgi:CHAT domain-containing protein